MPAWTYASFKALRSSVMCTALTVVRRMTSVGSVNVKPPSPKF